MIGRGDGGSSTRFGFRNQGTPSRCSGIGEDPNQICISLFLDIGIFYHDRGDQLLGSSVQTLDPNTYVFQKMVSERTNVLPPYTCHGCVHSTAEHLCHSVTKSPSSFSGEF